MLTLYPLALGAHIRDCRRRKHWSQTELARAAGLTQQTISSFENNPEVSSIATLYKILMALELEMRVDPKPLTPETQMEW